jgi:hypothetical protein
MKPAPVGVFDPAGKLDDSDWQRYANAVIRVQHAVHTRNGTPGRASETASYVLNKPVEASQALLACRVSKTTSYYRRNVVKFSEDHLCIRINAGASSACHNSISVQY